MSRRIRTLLMLAFVGLAVGPMLAVGLMLASVGFSNLVDHSLDYRRGVALRVAGEVQGLFDRQIQSLRQFDIMNDLLDLDRDQMSWRLMRYLSSNPLIEEIAVLDGAGRERVRHHNRLVIGVDDLRDRSAAAAVRAARSSRRAMVGEVEIDDMTGEPALPLVVPLIERHTGEVEAFLTARLRFAPI